MSTHRKLFGTDGVRGVANRGADYLRDRAEARPRARACVPQFHRPSSQNSHRQGYPPLGLHARDRDRVRHLLDGRGRVAGRSSAYPGDRVPDPQHARRRGRGHIGLAQSLPGQRDQVFFGRRIQARRRDRAPNRSAGVRRSRGRDASRARGRYRQGGANRRRARPLPGVSEVVPAALGRIRRVEGRDRLRQRRGLQGRSRGAGGTGRRGRGDRGRAQRHQYQSELRRDASRRDSRNRFARARQRRHRARRRRRSRDADRRARRSLRRRRHDGAAWAASSPPRAG